MYSLKFGDYQYIFEYDTEEEFQQRLADTLNTHKKLLELNNNINISKEEQDYYTAQETLKHFKNKETSSNNINWIELEGKFIAYKKKRVKTSLA